MPPKSVLPVFDHSPFFPIKCNSPSNFPIVTFSFVHCILTYNQNYAPLSYFPNNKISENLTGYFPTQKQYSIGRFYPFIPTLSFIILLYHQRLLQVYSFVFYFYFLFFWTLNADLNGFWYISFWSVKRNCSGNIKDAI